MRCGRGVCGRFLMKSVVVYPFIITVVEALMMPEYVVLLSRWGVGWRSTSPLVSLSATRPSLGVVGDPINSPRYQASQNR